MDYFAKRIIPCLDIKNARVVKGVNFLGLQDAGDPIEIAKRYNAEGADELTLLDISASYENRKTTIKLIEKLSKEVFIPLCVGGGISTLDDISRLLNVGCDKVSINSSAVNNPSLITHSAKKFGSQCIVVAMDVKKVLDGSYHIFVKGGREDTKIDALEWAKEIYELGAGEILLTSMDTDGAKKGFDLELIKEVSSIVDIPVIASGGAGKMEDFKDVFKAGAEAALAASIFHYKEIDIKELKSYLNLNKIPMRI